MTGQDKALAAVCGTYCPNCRFYGSKCAGCGAVKGKPFWVTEYQSDICRMYGCCVNEKHFEHCGDCLSLPCQIFVESADPSETTEQAKLSRQSRIATLKMRKQVGTSEWLRQQDSRKTNKE